MSSTPIINSGPGSAAQHPGEYGPVMPVYVWQYPLRLAHWGIVLSIAVLSVTGLYIHDPYISGQLDRPFFMGWIRFTHEAFGMLFMAMVLLRIYLFFGGNRWENWREMVPINRGRFVEMINVSKFYMFINPKPVAKIGHNAMAALSYIGIYSLALVEILTGLTLYWRLDHNRYLGWLVSWVPGMMSVPNIRLLHFLLMFVFICFGIFHVHLAMLISREEKRGLMDSIFIGWKIIPVKDVDKAESEEGRRA